MDIEWVKRAASISSRPTIDGYGSDASLVATLWYEPSGWWWRRPGGDADGPYGTDQQAKNAVYERLDAANNRDGDA